MPCDLPPLTPRQREVLELIGGERLTYGRAAERLELSAHTVRAYARQIRERAGLEVAPRDACAIVYRHHCELDA